MPAQHSGTGDVLDRALHAARTQTVPGQKGFFEAVAGKRSPLNRQSSRVARPFANQPFLGDTTRATVADPKDQAFLGQTNATNPTVAPKTRAEGTRIAQEYVKGADTRQVKKKPGSGAGVQGAALTSPNLAAVGQRALGLVGSGLPLGSAAPAAIQALSNLGLDPNARQQVIAGFSKDKTLELPGVKSSLVAAAFARGNSLPAHPNSRQLLTAALTDPHKGSYWDIIKNLPKDALYTPVYAAEGGFALGHATRAAAGGNPDELKAIGESQLAMVEHPGAFVQQHPFQAALLAIGAAKGAGSIAGKVAKLPETARDVTLSNYPLSPINRGTLDQNLTTRLAQKASDTLLAKGPEHAQSNALKNRVQGSASAIERKRALTTRRDMSEYAKARKGVNRRRQLSLLQNEVQGLTAAERETFYRNLGETPARTSQADLAGAQAKKFDKPLTEKEQRFVDAARVVGKQRTQDTIDLGRLSPEDAARRDFQPLAHVRAQQGDAAARRVIDAETEIRDLESKLANAPAADKRVASWQKRLEQVRAQVANDEGARLSSVKKRVDALQSVVDRQQAIPASELATRDRLAQQAADAFAGVPNEKGEPIQAPSKRAHQNAQMRTNVEGRVGTRFSRPAERKLSRLEAERARLESNVRLPSDIHNATTRRIEEQIASAPTKRVIQDSIESANREHQIAVDKFIAEQRALGADPVRVPFVRPSVKSEFSSPAQPVRANANLKVSGVGNDRSYGDLFRSGDYVQRPEDFNRQLFEPHHAADARKFVEQVVNPESGMGAVPVKNGELLSEATRERYVLRNRSNLRTKPKNADLSVDASDFSTSEAEALRTIEDLNEGWTTDPAEMKRVPDDGDFVLVPRPVHEQVNQVVRRVVPGTAEHRIQQGTRAFKTGVLMTRPTYPLTNLTSGVAQNSIGGVGIASWTRALRNSIPWGPGVEDAGFAAREFGHARGSTARSLWDEGKPFRALKQATIGNYVKGIRDLSIAVDNAARKAAYAKGAVREAKDLAGYNWLEKRFKPADDAVHDWLQKMADGDTPETRRAAEKALQLVNDLNGDYGGMRSTPLLDAAIPFHRWARFVFKLMYKTLPLKYPIRTAGLYDLGNIGQQGSGQAGILPQYLQEHIPLGGSPTRQFGLTTSRANSFASPGTMLEPTANGDIDYRGAISQLSPFAGIGYGAVMGKNLETGNPLMNGSGKPISSLADRAKFLGNQVSGFVPPIAAAAGGATGRPDTWIPFANDDKRKVGKTPLGGAQPEQPRWLPLVNQVSPFRITLRNDTADQYKGFKAFAAQLRKQFQDEMAAEATTPEKAAAITKKYTAIGAEAAKRKAYYEKNPKALAALLERGFGQR